MSMGKRISGKKIAEEIKNNLKQKVSHLEREVVFSIIYVGQDPVIDNFIKYKKKFGEDLGIDVIIHNFDREVEQEVLISEIKNISKTSDAMIIQLPLPKHLDTRTILDVVPVEKDVDMLSTLARESFSDDMSEMFPPVTGAMVEIIKSENYAIANRNILIVGYGNLVGKPFGAWLSRQEIPYKVLRKETREEEKQKLLKNAEVIISGAGIPNLIQPNMIGEGVVLLDAGTSEAGKKVIGDISSECYEKSLFYTPVPGGIGPLTIAILYQNVLKTIEK